MPETKLELQPVGARFIFEPEDAYKDIPLYRGTSYCDAVWRVTEGQELLVRPDSIDVCKWSPVVLGFKEQETSFEKRLSPRMEEVWGVYLAPLSSFEERGIEPDVVILRDYPETIMSLAADMGWDLYALEYADELDKSALGSLKEKRQLWNVKMMLALNHLLAALQNQAWWRKTTEFVFRSTLVSDIMDRVISRLMADMSMCRNSTVIPYKTGKVNVSYFCTGGIAWGMNRPDYITSGFPYPLFKDLQEKADLTW